MMCNEQFEATCPTLFISISILVLHCSVQVTMRRKRRSDLYITLVVILINLQYSILFDTILFYCFDIMYIFVTIHPLVIMNM